MGRKPHGHWKRIAEGMNAPSSMKVKTKSEGNSIVMAIKNMGGSASLRQLVSGFVVMRKT